MHNIAMDSNKYTNQNLSLSEESQDVDLTAFDQETAQTQTSINELLDNIDEASNIDDMISSYDYNPVSMHDIGIEIGLKTSSIDPINTDLQAEKAIIASIINNPSLLIEVADQILPEHFYSPKHRAVYTAILEVDQFGEMIDEISILEQIKNSYTIEKTKTTKDINRNYLLNLRITNLLRDNITTLCKRIKNLFILRSITQLSDELKNDTFEGRVVEEILDKAQNKLHQLSETKADKNVYSIRDVIADSGLEHNNFAKQVQRNVISSGFVAIDNILGGLHGSDLMILAARPGMGKTSLALKILEKVSKNGEGVLMFSLEMSKEQLVKKVISSLSKLPLRDIHLNKVGEDPNFMAKYSAGVGQAINLPIWIDDTSSLNINELKSKARKLMMRNNIKLIIVDYLQLLSPTTKASNQNRTYEVGEISRGLKILAKDLNVPVLALSQLSRSVEARDDKRPMLSDLRESGSLEQDADIVMFIHREAMYRKDGDKAESGNQLKPDIKHDEVQKADVIIAKHRNGATGRIELDWVPKRATFEGRSSTST
jgi:replicative DNA helicase